MSLPTIADQANPSRGSKWRTWLESASWQRTLRLWSGTFIFIFLFMHLANHAIGIFGINALDIVQTWRWKLWNNALALGLLYSAFAVHILLGLWRIVARKTFRIPPDEAIQIASGLIIPFFLLPHVIGTRVAMTWTGDGNGYYGPVLYALWTNKAFWQSALVLIAWGHGVLGLYLAFRHRPWFSTLRPVASVVVIGLPLLAIAGFVSAGREAVRLQMAASMTSETHRQMEQLHFALQGAYVALGVVFVILFVILNIQFLRRKIGPQLTVKYRGRGPVKVPRGSSILEASRIHNVPHPSVCRGKGRCSTCRVQVLSDLAELPEPNSAERLTLERIGAPPSVRLACQLRPGKDIAVSVLLPVLGRSGDTETSAEAERWAGEREASILVLDVRAFEVFVGTQQPYELSALVNRLSVELEQAIRSHSGIVSTFQGNGLMASFEAQDKPQQGARRAIACVRDIALLVKNLNKEMGGALPLPIRVGIGIHSGSVTLARIGETEAQSRMMAFGDVVRAASALQNATRSMLTDCIVSQRTAILGQLATKSLRTLTIDVEGLDGALKAYAIDNLQSMQTGTAKDEMEVDAQ